MARAARLPGFVNVHSHAFQRALRGRAAGGDFWSWRETMLALAERQTPPRCASSTPAPIARCAPRATPRSASSTTSALETALAAAEAAEEAGIAFVCLFAAYARGGLERMRQPSVTAYLGELEALRGRGIAVGVAPHSVRACPRDWLEELGRYADREALPLHVHADEQPREIDECLAEHGLRPIELLADCGCLGERTVVVHATHANGGELDLLRDAGAAICACPTTEADLGDGFLPVIRVRHRSIPLCIGSDSNVRIDPFEELRELEGIGRRQSGARGVFDDGRAVGDRRRERGRGARPRPVGGDRRRPRPPVARRRRRRARSARRSSRAAARTSSWTPEPRPPLRWPRWTSPSSPSTRPSSSGRARCPSSSTSGPSGAGRATRSRRCSRARSSRAAARSSSSRSTSTRTPGSPASSASAGSRRSRRSATARS